MEEHFPDGTTPEKQLKIHMHQARLRSLAVQVVQAGKAAPAAPAEQALPRAPAAPAEFPEHKAPVLRAVLPTAEDSPVTTSGHSTRTSRSELLR